MEIAEYQPPPPRPLPPAKPQRKFRSAVIMSAIFLGSFVVCLAVLSRPELARRLAQHEVQAPTALVQRQPLPVQAANASATKEGPLKETKEVSIFQ